MTGISFEAYDELAESDESDEALFSTPRDRLRRPSTATPRNYSPPRPTSNNVTQTQFQAALARIGGDIKKNSDAIQGITSQISTITSRHEKEIAGLKKDLKSKVSDLQQSSILPFLLLQPKTKDVATVKVDGAGRPLLDADGNVVTETTKVQVASDNSLMPLVLIMALSGGGLGGSSSSNGQDQGLMGGPMGLLLILALTGGLGSKS